MNTTIVVVAIIIGIVVLAAAVLFAIWNARQRRRANLQQRFGPEYEREVRARGSERDADQHLSARSRIGVTGSTSANWSLRPATATPNAGRPCRRSSSTGPDARWMRRTGWSRM
jgi:FtsZ-interacting cell division protein ZipA